MTFLLPFFCLLKLPLLKLRPTVKRLYLIYPERCLMNKGSSRSFKSTIFWQKNDPWFPDFCHPDVLATWQPYAPEPKELRWVNNGCKLNEQSGYWEAQDGCLVLPRFLANLILYFLHFFIYYVAKSCPTLFATPWTVARQAPLSMGFSRQDYWSGLPCPPPGDLPNPGMEPTSLLSPALAGGFFTTSAPGKPQEEKMFGQKVCFAAKCLR